MSCDRYWREGVVRAERGEPDAHRDGCEDCTRAHAAHQRIVLALPSVGAGQRTDPHWQARVWREVARERRSWYARWTTWLGALLASGTTVLAAAALMSYCGSVPHGAASLAVSDDASQRAASQRDVPLVARADRGSGILLTVRSESRPRIEVIGVAGAMRATSVAVGDRIRVLAGTADEVRVYRADRLVFACAGAPATGCGRDETGVVAETTLATAGDYQVVLVTKAVPPVGDFDRDLSAVVAAGGDFRTTRFQVR